MHSLIVCARAESVANAVSNGIEHGPDVCSLVERLHDVGAADWISWELDIVAVGHGRQVSGRIALVHGVRAGDCELGLEGAANAIGRQLGDVEQFPLGHHGDVGALDHRAVVEFEAISWEGLVVQRLEGDDRPNVGIAVTSRVASESPIQCR